jgi:hypothetical protein
MSNLPSIFNRNSMTVESDARSAEYSAAHERKICHLPAQEASYAE